jgi:hypothetical protein
MWKRAHGTDITLNGGPVGEFSTGLAYRALRRLRRRASFSTGALLSIIGGGGGGPPKGNAGGEFKGGSGNGASLSMEALIGEPGGAGGSFARGPEGYERKALGMGISLHGGSVGQP